MARFSPDPQAEAGVRELRRSVLQEVGEGFGRVVLWWTVRESRCLRAACRDFLRREVVLSSTAAARPSLWGSVIWREGKIMSGLQQLIPPLLSALTTVEIQDPGQLEMTPEKSNFH